jgi:2-keto-4-pentenoate hydratase
MTMTDDQIRDEAELLDQAESTATRIRQTTSVELAFVLGRDLSGSGPGGKATAGDVMTATDHVTPAAELIAARSHRRDPDTGRTRTVVDTIAGNAAVDFGPHGSFGLRFAAP